MSEAPYQKLLTYKYSVIICDLNYKFLQSFLAGRENLRLREQMDQAARSGKQNIAEGASQGTSLKGYIKLLGVARGSFQELLEDYWDFSRRWGILLWDKGDRRFMGYRITISLTSPIPPLPHIPPNSEIWVNILVDLLNRTNYLLDKQKKALEEKHMKEGGFTEGLFRKRLEYRGKIR